MNLKSTLIAGGLLAMAMASTSASAITVLGVTWDPNSPVDLTTTGVLWEEAPSNVIGSTVTGFGAFTLLNNNDVATYGAGSKILTFSFTAQLASFTPLSATQGLFAYTLSAPLNVYSTSTAAYDVTNLASQTQANAQSGDLFLSTTLTAANLTGLGLNFASPNAKSGTGNGWLEVAGGAAAVYFDTNTQSDPNGVLADFTFSSSFNQAPSQSPAGFPYTGTVTVTGQTNNVNVPEPASIALLGLGLMAFGLRRRNQI